MKTQEKSLHGETFVLTSLNLETFVCKARGLDVVCFDESILLSKIKNMDGQRSLCENCSDLIGTLFSSLAFPVAHVQRLAFFSRWQQASMKQCLMQSAIQTFRSRWCPSERPSEIPLTKSQAESATGQTYNSEFRSWLHHGS